MRMFRESVNELDSAVRPITWHTPVNEFGQPRTVTVANFRVLGDRSISAKLVPIVMVAASDARRWYRMADDEGGEEGGDGAVWRCNVAILTAFGAMYASPYIQLFYRPPMGDYVMK